MGFGALQFAAPLALIALAALPVLWLLLRATPPAPLRALFPPLALLRDLEDTEETPDSAPLWLRLLRMLIAVLCIIALAMPFWAPRNTAKDADGPLMVIIDNGWASATSWSQMQKSAAALANANADTMALVLTAPMVAGAPQSELSFTGQAQFRQMLGDQSAQSWAPDRMAALATIEALNDAGGLPPNLRLVWLSDGLDHGRAKAFMAGLGTYGPVDVYAPLAGEEALVMAPPQANARGLELSLLRSKSRAAQTISVQAIDEDDAVLARVDLEFAQDEALAKGEIILPLTLRNRLKLLRVPSAPSAAASWVFDGGWSRPLVGLITPGGDADRQPLLSGYYYLAKAMGSNAEIVRGPLDDLLAQNPAVLVLSDPAQPPEAGMEKLAGFVDGGGLLIRFAGPHLAVSSDALVPVNLRQGGRLMGGAFGWETPQELAPFAANSPFFGLVGGVDAAVRRQVLALPDTNLNDRVWARLQDGTPLVSSADRGAGRIVLFHVTASPDWSDLPLSGLFAGMLERTLAFAKKRSGTQIDAQIGSWVLDQALLANGALKAPEGAAPFLEAQTDITSLAPSAQNPPGLYRNGAFSAALNIGNTVSNLTALPTPPAGVRFVEGAAQGSLALKGPALLLALVLLGVDIWAALMLAGRLRFLRKFVPANVAGAALAVAVMLVAQPAFDAHAQVQIKNTTKLDTALQAAQATHLAYIRTGNGRVDEMSRAGLFGLSLTLKQRTTVEPEEPIGVNPDKDDLSSYSLIYWPLLKPPTLTPGAIAALDSYLKNGGMLVIDTQDDGLRAKAAGGVDPALAAVFGQISVPPLRPVDGQHVLTRTYYLIHDFAGRTNNGRVWVEADAGGSSLDGVSGIIAGSNDWAAAWALDQNGQPMAALSDVIPRQREMARRFGINLVMYSLTGNYKADQVHIPALLERLGEQ